MSSLDSTQDITAGDGEAEATTATQHAQALGQKPRSKLVLHTARARSARERIWTNQSYNFEQFVDMFMIHRADARKDGPAYLPGHLIGTTRTKEAVTGISALVYDIDGKQSLADVIEKVAATQKYAIVYTTYSHLKSDTYIRSDKFIAWCRAQSLPTTNHTQENVWAYCLEKDLGHLKDAVVQERFAHTDDGLCVHIRHAPLDKCRVIFPLASWFGFQAHGQTSAENILAWKQTYHGVGRALGLEFDPACEDPSRLYYYPSHPLNRTEDEYTIGVFDNADEPLALLDYQDYKHAPLSAISGAIRDQMLSDGGFLEKGEQNYELKLPGGTVINIAEWMRKYGRGIGPALVETLRIKVPDIFRGEEVAGKPGMHHIECPFEELHTTAGGTGTFIGEETESGFPRIHCRHAHCTDQRNEDFVAKMLTNGWLDGHALEVIKGAAEMQSAGGDFDLIPYITAALSRPMATAVMNAAASTGPAVIPTDLDAMRSLLTENTAWALVGLAKMYSFQTADEQEGGDTANRNGAGFNARDGKFLTSLAQQFADKGTLSLKQMTSLHKSLPKYAAQLLPFAGELAELAAPIERELLAELDEAAERDEANADLPSGFFRTELDDGCVVIQIDTGEKDVKATVCGDLKPISATISISGEAKHGIGVEFLDRQSKPQRVFFDQGDFFGDGDKWVKKLANAGLHIEHVGMTKKLIHGLKTARVAYKAEKCGWATLNDNKVFVLPDRVIGEVGGAELIFAGDRASYKFAQNGTLADWNDNVAALAVGNSRMAFAVSMAFAGPLLDVYNHEGFGVLYYCDTSRGKTTCLQAHASVWGHGQKKGAQAYIVRMNSTLTALENVLERASDTAGSYDELGELQKGAGTFGYNVGNGTGKGRGKTDGTDRVVKTFNVACLITGEKSYADKIEEEGARVTGGQNARIITIKADTRRHFAFDDLHGAVDGKAFADKVSRAAESYYGTPAIAFVEDVVAHRDQIAARRDEIEKQATVWTPAKAGPDVGRVARHFALVAFAGELAVSAGILNWPKGTATSQAKIMFDDWIKERGGIAASVALDGLHRLMGDIAIHGASHYQRNHQDFIHQRHGYTWDDGDWVYYAFEDEAFRKLIGSCSQDSVLDLLEERRQLVRDGKHKKKKVARTVSEQRPRCVTIRVPIEHDDEPISATIDKRDDAATPVQSSPAMGDRKFVEVSEADRCAIAKVLNRKRAKFLISTFRLQNTARTDFHDPPDEVVVWN